MKNYFKMTIFSLVAIFAMSFASASQPEINGESMEMDILQKDCHITDYWIHTSSGEWIHIYFESCIEV